jgi:hypothetical protein
VLPRSFSDAFPEMIFSGMSVSLAAPEMDCFPGMPIKYQKLKLQHQQLKSTLAQFWA